MKEMEAVAGNQQIMEEASVWIIRMDRGDYCVEELIDWMRLSEEHASSLFQLASTWDNTDILCYLSEVFPLQQRKKTMVRPLAVAASLLVAAGVSFLLLSDSPVSGIQGPTETADATRYSADYETAIGEHSTVNLPDGSAIVLNTDTKISVEFTDQQRMVTLPSGEAHFEVAHDPDRPLSVTAGNKIVEAVGTAFSVELLREGEITVIVTEGKVIVRDNIQQPQSYPDALLEEVIPLSRGEMFFLSENDEEVSPVSGEDIAQALSWRQGNLVFKGESLKYAIEEINRYTKIKIRISDQDLEQVKLAGLFRAGDVDGLLIALQETFQINHKRIGQDLIVLSRD